MMGRGLPIDVNGLQSGAINMLRDAGMMEEVRGTDNGMVRLYAWKPYAVSLGYNQNASAIDPIRCQDRGIDIVRRPTGGRAVLHAEEITYAVATPLNGFTAQEWYARIHQAIARGLASIGLDDATFVKSQPHFADVYKQSSGALCFSSSARYELEWNGKKFVGSAQRVIGGVLLQHGSILLGPYHLQLAQVLNIDESKRAGMLALLKQRSISIGEIMGRSVSYDECCEPLKRSFEEEFQYDHVPVESSIP